jgi:hypothetical protein
MTLLLAIGIGVYLRKREVKTQAELVGQPSYTDFTTLLRLISPVVLVLALFLTIIEPGGTLRHVSQGLRAIPAENAVHYDFDGKFALIGYDAPEQVEAGDTMIVTLYWKATTSLDENYQVFVHLLGPDGGPVAQSDKLNPGDFPTELWPLDRYVRDAHRIEVPAGLAAGEYQLTAGLWQLQTGKRLLIDGGQQEFATLREYHAGN